jgi:hypothetical protein
MVKRRRGGKGDSVGGKKIKMHNNVIVTGLELMTCVEKHIITIETQ